MKDEITINGTVYVKKTIEEIKKRWKGLPDINGLEDSDAVCPNCGTVNEADAGVFTCPHCLGCSNKVHSHVISYREYKELKKLSKKKQIKKLIENENHSWCKDGGYNDNSYLIYEIKKAQT